MRTDDDGGRRRNRLATVSKWFHYPEVLASDASRELVPNMANLADLDPSFSVPCRQCSALLQKGNRFCPFCFEDQFAERDAAGDASPPVEGGRADAAVAPRPGRLIIDFADTGPPGAEEAIQIPGPAGASLEEAGSEIGFVRPGLFSATEDLGDGARGGARFATPRRLVIGVACALVLVALPAGLRRAYFDVPPAGVHAALKPLAEPPAPAPPEPPVELAPVPAALPEAPVAIDPEPAGSKAAVGNKGCSEALAAMALCPGQ
ncbi:hypothetical protein [Variovorax saccharolyticus]|uniref:hypothetical protein n=1 Tax=Variovorax saccharolyticus TaxID=3053516 RepID=UPI002576B6E0|nr:hypothetical protein [Variovorax sp. J22R187]MDM0016602.1 hypothetical protein [Variovorax sp. J22R187]